MYVHTDEQCPTQRWRVQTTYVHVNEMFMYAIKEREKGEGKQDRDRKREIGSNLETLITSDAHM